MSKNVLYTYQPNGKGGWTITAAWVNYRRPSYESNKRALQFGNMADVRNRLDAVWEYFQS